MIRVFVLVCLCAGALHGADWPQLLGPLRNGTTAETNLSSTWPKEGPRTEWRFKAGEGWAGPVVASNRVVLFHRVGDKEVLQCLDATNGAALWRSEYPAAYRDDFGFDAGPRATPTIGGDRIFTFGANGELTAWALQSGKRLWQVETRKQFGASKGFFGIATSPLVESDRIIANVGGRDGAGIVAFDVTSGKVLWKATSDEASYSSPVATTIAGKRQALALTRANLVALDPELGSLLWEFPFRPNIQASVSAATPIVIGERIFISASYGAGAALLKYKEAKPDVLWSGDEILSNHYTTSVHHGGYLYGFHGRQEQRSHFRCVDLESSKVRWSEDHFGAGHIVVSGDKLIVLSERGELLLVRATAEKLAILARAQILGSDCRAHPAIANGRFYARDKASLVCVMLPLAQ